MWTLERDAAVPFWRPRDPGPEAVLLFSTRRGGVSRAPYDTLNLGRSTEDDPEAVTANRERFLAAPALEPHRLPPGAPTEDGPEAVTATRERFLAAAPLEPHRLATAGQVHGTRVVAVTAPGHH